MSERRESEPFLPPIQFWFVIREVPAGGAPEQIKEQWLNVPLPCRIPRYEAPEAHLVTEVGEGDESLKLIEDGVCIEADDAIKALGIFGRQEAAEWWDIYYGKSEAALVFRYYEGQIFSTDFLERILPGIKNFDTIHP